MVFFDVHDLVDITALGGVDADCDVGNDFLPDCLPGVGSLLRVAS